jgi:hypothetical protein
MPKRIVLIPARRFIRLVNDHQNFVIAILMFALLIALGFAVAGWTAARNAERSVTSLEDVLAKTQSVAQKTQNVAQVATCFSAARSRPLLTTILSALASGEHDPAVRAAYDQLIGSYATAPTPGILGEPTIERCTRLAKRLHVDPTPYLD